jgi:hypothetical protein
LSTKVPALLSTSLEARLVGLEHYRLGFEEQLLGRPIFIDIARDTLHLDDDSNLMAFCCVDPVSFDFETRLQLGQHPNLLELLPTDTTTAEVEVRHLAIESAFLKDLIFALPRFGALQSVLLPKPDDDPIHRRISPTATRYAERKFVEDRKAMEDGLEAKWKIMSSKNGGSFKRPNLEFLTPKQMRERLGMSMEPRALY